MVNCMGNATKGETPEKKKRRKQPPPASVSKKPRTLKADGTESKFSMLTELSDKHYYFCKRYILNNRNAAKAARDCGFNEWYCQINLLKQPLIQQEIERYSAERMKRFDVTADRIIAEMVKVAFGNVAHFIRLMPDGQPIIDCSEVGEDDLAALSEITQDVYYERTSSDPEEPAEPVKKTKIKFHSKVQALEWLGRAFKITDGGDMDGDTPEQKAGKIRRILLAMANQDGVGIS
jgi:phage terminase small subunit